MILDLDETLIHSQHQGPGAKVAKTVTQGTPPDFTLEVVIDTQPVTFKIHKRPHVDYFLEVVSFFLEFFFDFVF